nr:DUF3253 domain-containing protein [uncultured Tateyamaria sp.]
MTDDRDIEAAILDGVARRGAGKTICPSEVARSLSPQEWRALMPHVRRVVQTLADVRQISVTQKGVPVSALSAKGPIRLGLPSGPVSS